MGAHYDVEITFNLREDVASEVVSAIAYLIGDLKEAPERPNHPYFTDYSWGSGVLAQGVGVAPNRGASICSFSRVYRFGRAGQEHYQYTFHLRVACKLESVWEDYLYFVQWVAPYCDGRQFVGYYLSECKCQPTLIYVSDGGVYIQEMEEPPKSVIDGSAWLEDPTERANVSVRRHRCKPWWMFWR
jgi:hypothetical protein